MLRKRTAGRWDAKCRLRSQRWYPEQMKTQLAIKWKWLLLRVLGSKQTSTMYEKRHCPPVLMFIFHRLKSSSVQRKPMKKCSIYLEILLSEIGIEWVFLPVLTGINQPATAQHCMHPNKSALSKSDSETTKLNTTWVSKSLLNALTKPSGRLLLIM